MQKYIVLLSVQTTAFTFIDVLAQDQDDAVEQAKTSVTQSHWQLDEVNIANLTNSQAWLASAPIPSQSGDTQNV
ncbi:MAG: hypothetical protein NW224_16870 [Leptolyngbyaceae cyanobacterium bins.302]|nr:hypothetical protein [Leptolyngbyaceae cyanobacterium bins.302]